MPANAETGAPSRRDLHYAAGTLARSRRSREHVDKLDIPPSGCDYPADMDRAVVGMGLGMLACSAVYGGLREPGAMGFADALALFAILTGLSFVYAGR